MYILKSECNFDSAHFLAGYQGKCSNIHGHRWIVVVEAMAEKLEKGGQLDGMIVDFSDFKKDLSDMVEFFDHKLIFEKGTMKEKTIQCLLEEGHELVEVDFRPTAENFSKHFYEYMSNKGYKIRNAEVHESPKNCAIYGGEVIEI